MESNTQTQRVTMTDAARDPITHGKALWDRVNAIARKFRIEHARQRGWKFFISCITAGDGLWTIELHAERELKGGGR